MKDKIKETFNQVHAEKDLKEATRAFLAQKTNGYTKSKKSNYKLIAAAAACLLLLLFGGHRFYFTPTVAVSIDINPSIELGINRFNRVISVKSYNDDGQELINLLNIKYMDYSEAIDQILNNENISALLSENEFMTIAVTDSNGTQSSDIFSNIESYTSENRNICCYLALPDEVENAHELGLSYGKYRAFLELQAVKPDITPEDIQNMTMREIRDLTASLSSDGEADTEEDINGEYNNNSNGSGSGNGYGHGNGNDSGNGYRHGQE